MDLGYARPSTSGGDLDQQLAVLAGHGVPAGQVYADRALGATADRPEFAALLATARPGDTVVAATLDRLGRNLRECLTVVTELGERGVGVRTVCDSLPIDTTATSGTGEVVATLLEMLARMDKVFMRERAAHARTTAAAGKQPGRPRKLDPAQLRTAREALDAGRPAREVAAAAGVSRATLYRYLAQPGRPPETETGTVETAPGEAGDPRPALSGLGPPGEHPSAAPAVLVGRRDPAPAHQDPLPARVPVAPEPVRRPRSPTPESPRAWAKRVRRWSTAEAALEELVTLTRDAESGSWRVTDDDGTFLGSLDRTARLGGQPRWRARDRDGHLLGHGPWRTRIEALTGLLDYYIRRPSRP